MTFMSWLLFMIIIYRHDDGDKKMISWQKENWVEGISYVQSLSSDSFQVWSFCVKATDKRFSHILGAGAQSHGRGIKEEGDCYETW